MSGEHRRQVQFGDSIYDEDGNELGRVRAYDESGFYVSSAEGVSTMNQAQSKTGEKTLMWRCWDCGEMGQISDMPETCPSCGAGSEEIYYWQED
ncbi:MAG: hypothetical protein PPP58_07500 [Natronomonas sp.]